MEKRRFGKLGVATPPLLARDDDPPGVVAPEGTSVSPKLGMDLDFEMRLSYVEMRLGTMSRGTSMPQDGVQGERRWRCRWGWRSSSRMRARTERMTSDGMR